MGIFISYRREDSGPSAVHLQTTLGGHFGESAVFLDTQHIPAGARWPKELQQQLARAKVLVAVIGERWGGSGEVPRILLDDDWVRKEIAFALAKPIHVVPVLIDNASKPERSSLPQSIQDLADLQVYERSCPLAWCTSLNLDKMGSEAQRITADNLGAWLSLMICKPSNCM